MSGRQYPEWAGKLHFWMMFIGSNLTFFPQHFLGRQGMPRRYIDYPEAFAYWNWFSSIGAFLSFASFVFFIGIVFYTLLCGPPRDREQLLERIRRHAGMDPALARRPNTRSSSCRSVRTGTSPTRTKRDSDLKGPRADKPGALFHFRSLKGSRCGWLLFLLILVAFAFGGYLAITGWFLAQHRGQHPDGRPAGHGAWRRPNSPKTRWSLGYRGTPMEALGPALPDRRDRDAAWPGRGLAGSRRRARGRPRDLCPRHRRHARETAIAQLSILHEAGWTVLLISYRNHDGAPPSPDGRYGFGLRNGPTLRLQWPTWLPGPDGRACWSRPNRWAAAVLGQFLAQSPLADRSRPSRWTVPAISFSAVTGHLAADERQSPRRAWPGSPAGCCPGSPACRLTRPRSPPSTQPSPARSSSPMARATGSCRFPLAGPGRGRTGPTVTLWTEAPTPWLIRRGPRGLPFGLSGLSCRA